MGEDEAADRYEGWNVALKPAHEPVVVARKPLSGTVAATVLEHGTGGLNVDGCRVGMSDEDRAVVDSRSGGQFEEDHWQGPKLAREVGERFTSSLAGRWPANVVLSHMEECVPVGTRNVKGSAPASGPTLSATESVAHGDYTGERGEVPSYQDETVTSWECHPDCAVRLLDEQTGESKSHSHDRGLQGRHDPSSPHTKHTKDGSDGVRGHADSGGASRFFPTFGGSHERQEGCSLADAAGLVPQAGLPAADGVHRPQGSEASGPGVQEAVRFRYVAKASRGERNAGLEGFEEAWTPTMGNGIGGKPHDEDVAEPKRNVHPTVKPISLMRWLVRLVTPPEGTVLDPFTGSGSTGAACMLEGFDFVGLEREPEYVEIARARIGWWLKHRGDGEAAEILAAGEARDEVEATGQASLFD